MGCSAFAVVVVVTLDITKSVRPRITITTRSRHSMWHIMSTSDVLTCTVAILQSVNTSGSIFIVTWYFNFQQTIIRYTQKVHPALKSAAKTGLIWVELSVLLKNLGGLRLLAGCLMSFNNYTPNFNDISASRSHAGPLSIIISPVHSSWSPLS